MAGGVVGSGAGVGATLGVAAGAGVCVALDCGLGFGWVSSASLSGAWSGWRRLTPASRAFRSTCRAAWVRRRFRRMPIRMAAIAAIAPRIAAGLYGLAVVQEDIADAEHNTTRFVVLARGAPPPAGSGPFMTSFMFEVKNVPAALYKALGGFATNGVNMTKLESYQQGASFAATRFYCDIEGAPGDPRVDAALD